MNDYDYEYESEYDYDPADVGLFHEFGNYDYDPHFVPPLSDEDEDNNETD